MFQRAVFAASRINLISSSDEFQHSVEPELGLGAVVRLNSGGPHMMVVDVTGDKVTTAWRNSDEKIKESVFPRACVHRALVV